MSALDELKNGVVSIDATSPQGKMSTKINYSEDGIISKPKTIVEPIVKDVRGTVTINQIDPTSVEEETVPPMDAANALAKSILDGPDSAFAKYVENEKKEMDEWVAQKQEEAELEGSVESEDDFGEDDDLTDDLDLDFDDDNDEVIFDDKSANMVIPQETVEKQFDHEEDTSVIEDEYDAEEVDEDQDIDIDVEEGKDNIGNFDGADEEEEDDEIHNSDTVEEDDEELLKRLKDMATEKLKPASKKLDISSFTVVKKPVTNVAPFFKAHKAKVAKWVLPSQNATVFMKEFSGSELEQLREYSEDSSSLDSLNRRFHMIYSHIVSPKPATFEQWLKVTPYKDVDHYFFAIYIASFNGANFLPIDCSNDKCKNTFLSDNINVMDMVQFKNKEAKEKFYNLYRSETMVSGKGLFATEVIPLNDKVAIGFRDPSIYNVFEVASLSTKVRTKYSSIIDYIPYIDELYVIDYENNSLVPVGYKKFTNNTAKTTESKLLKYSKILDTLAVDEFGPVKAYAREIVNIDSGMSYVYPPVECPKCKTLSPEITTTAEELVFTRYQLGALINTSLN